MFAICDIDTRFFVFITKRQSYKGFTICIFYRYFLVAVFQHFRKGMKNSCCFRSSPLFKDLVFKQVLFITRNKIIMTLKILNNSRGEIKEVD